MPESCCTAIRGRQTSAARRIAGCVATARTIERSSEAAAGAAGSKSALEEVRLPSPHGVPEASGLGGSTSGLLE